MNWVALLIRKAHVLVMTDSFTISLHPSGTTQIKSTPNYTWQPTKYLKIVIIPQAETRELEVPTVNWSGKPSSVKWMPSRWSWPIEDANWVLVIGQWICWPGRPLWMKYLIQSMRAWVQVPRTECKSRCACEPCNPGAEKGGGMATGSLEVSLWPPHSHTLTYYIPMVDY